MIKIIAISLIIIFIISLLLFYHLYKKRMENFEDSKKTALRKNKI